MEKVCSICSGPLDDEFGHNPYPVRLKIEDRCCAYCNYHIVTVARIALMKKSAKESDKETTE